MKKLILMPLALALVVGCGDDSTTPTDGGADGGGDASADTGVVVGACAFPDEQMGPCCYRKSNADNLDMPTMRVSGVQITTPPSLSTIIVTTLLVAALDDELFNWLIDTEISGTDVTLTTGYGVKNADNTFSFTMGTAPGPGDPNRWDPVVISGSIAGETVSAPALNETFTVPVLDEDGMTVTLELPLRNMSIEMATLSEDRSCIGRRLPGNRWTSDEGLLTAYITVEDADAGVLDIPDAGINTTLCMFTANVSGEPEGTTCAMVDQATWPTKPDALCDDTTCTQDPGDGSVCDPATTCNAWFISAGFAAQGVEITG